MILQTLPSLWGHVWLLTDRATNWTQETNHGWQKGGWGSGQEADTKAPSYIPFRRMGQTCWLTLLWSFGCFIFSNSSQEKDKEHEGRFQRDVSLPHTNISSITIGLFLTNGLGKNRRKQNSALTLGSRKIPAVEIKQPDWWPNDE